MLDGLPKFHSVNKFDTLFFYENTLIISIRLIMGKIRLYGGYFEISSRNLLFITGFKGLIIRGI